MKKSLTALAVLGVFAGSAMAADVTLYGALDTGFEYFHKKTTKFDGSSEKSDTFDMQTGWDTGNRWGLNLQVVKRSLKAQKRSRHFS